MNRMCVVLILALEIGLPAVARAQVTNFSGTWILDPSKTSMTGLPTGPPSGVASSQPPGGSDPVRIGGTIRPPTKVKDVKPIYPTVAQSKRIAGMVIMEAVIAPDGSVTSARILQSIPELDQAALDAVRQWQFTPTLLNGVAVPVVMTVTTNFTLGNAKPTPSTPTAAGAARAMSPRPPNALPPGVTGSALSAPGSAGSASGPSGRLTISQTAETLTITRDAAIGSTVTVYRLDGSDSKNVTTYPPRGASTTPMELVSIYQSRWDGGRLVTAITTAPGSPGPAPRTQTLSLENDTLVIETTGPGPAGSGPVVQRSVYKKGGGQ